MGAVKPDRLRAEQRRPAALEFETVRRAGALVGRRSVTEQQPFDVGARVRLLNVTGDAPEPATDAASSAAGDEPDR